MIINTEKIEDAKKMIAKGSYPIIINAKSYEFNRALLEYGKFDILIGIDSKSSTKRLRQGGAIFDIYSAKVASKNKVSIGFDLNELAKLSDREKGERMARIRKIIKLCIKAHANIEAINYSQFQGARAVLESLGARSALIKKSISF